MGETSSSRKRRRDSSASRSRSRSRTRKGSTRDKTRHRHSRSRSRSRRHSRSSRRSRSVSSASSRSPSRSRSRSRSASRREKDRKHAKRSRRSSSPSRKSRKKSSSHKSKKSSRDKRHRDKDRSASRSRSRPRKEKEKAHNKKSEEPSASTPAATTLAVAEAATHTKETNAASATALPEVPVVAVEKQHHGTRRSRSPARKSHRSRSRSRGRTATKDAKKEAPKPLTFTGISLKATKGKPNGSTTAVSNGAVPNSVTAVDDEKQRRREKLKLWREQQLQQKMPDADHEQTQLVRSFLAADDPVPKRIKLWSLDEAGEEKQESPEDKLKREKQQEEQRQREQKVVEEVDPLDAYMAGLVDEAAIQQSITNPAANVISLDEIQSQEKLNIYGTFLPPAATLQASRVPTPTPSNEEKLITQLEPQESEKEREAREERELKEFMRALREKREQEEKEAPAATAAHGVESVDSITGTKKDETGRIYQGVDEDTLREDDANNVDQRSALEILQEAQKKKDIQPVDHSKVEYIPFQKKFYVVPSEIKSLSDEEVQGIRDELEIKIRGKNCPRPLDKWTQCGFSVRMLQLIQKQGYAEPFAIQRQALPAIMSGRDVIGIAKTGSGKTLAFLLPMFRHILHQPPLKEGEGPIGLIMAPARELAQQIYIEAKRFAKGLGMRATAVYGGSSVSEQIGNLKRGSDIVICTPGRMIDILCMNAGKMVSLKRVTYVVLDEADRMFDMGFEPQITKIMLNIRPDRQTLLFSATFPKAVETLARKVLKKPVEITVGARSTASGDIVQYVEVREEKDKFMRLLQLLGLWYEKGNVLVFVNTQQACDQLFQDLMKAGYPGLSLHGGKDQVDRDFTIDDFKRKVRTLMVATSVAGRGLDVKDLVLVINYHCPNHLEDYVHRVGRTGRAGRKGTAYTFISPDEEEYSVDLVKALESGKQVVPPELTALADNFKERVRKGEARYHGSGFKGKGFTFDGNEKNESQRVADMQKRQYELQEGIAVENHDASDDDDADSVEDGASTGPTAAAAVPSAVAPADVPLDNEALSAVRKAQQIAQILDRQYKKSQSNISGADEEHFEEELEINDYPQQARWKVTQKEATERVAELTGAAVITRGSFVQAGRKPNAGERKLYLAIEGPSRVAVLEAKRELQRILDETTLQVGLGGDRHGRYNV